MPGGGGYPGAFSINDLFFGSGLCGFVRAPGTVNTGGLEMHAFSKGSEGSWLSGLMKVTSWDPSHMEGARVEFYYPSCSWVFCASLP